MVHNLQNEHYQVSVKEAGAELCSFFSKEENLEYIWQADPQVWPRHAPVLFPIVGKLPDGKYSYGGKTYELSQHGFARDHNFELIRKTETEILLELRESEQTLAVYPFRFRLQVIYRLDGNALETTFKVENPAETDLYFSIGGHPAFNCPLLPGESFVDYYLEFEHPETQSRYLLDQGLLNGGTEPLLKEETKLPLSYDLFLHDALVFKNLASERIELKNLRHSHGLSFGFKDFPFFGIWTKKPGAGFICLEPWHGIAGKVGDSGELEQKEGILKLAAGEVFSCAYTIRVN